jgi:multidrug efflux system membrane fusion protein
MLGFIALFSITGCDRAATGAAGNRTSAPPLPVPVTAVRVIREDVPVQVRAIGYVEPHATVTLRPQIDGQIEKVHFSEGQEVQAGDLMFTIDPRSFEATTRWAEANLAREQAMADQALRELARIKELRENEQAAERELDMATADAESKAAEVRAMKADLERARLQLAYCRIHAPMNGRAGSFLVHPGNIVKANETDLVVINQLSPIFVTFSVPERYVGKVRMAEPNGLQVRIELTETPIGEVGRLTFIDNQVDRATGMVRLKATFENRERHLWPGRYGNVLLTTETLGQATVVPSSAVQQGQTKPFVFIVNANQEVEMRGVDVGYSFGEKTVITRGVSEGEWVVIDGQLRLTPGAKVERRDASSMPASPITSGKRP